MTRALVYTGQASLDFDEIFAFIASDNPLRARSYVEEIRAACRSLRETPYLGRPRSDLRPELRVVTMRRRVVIAYHVLPDTILILRVFPAGRDYDALMREG